MTAHHKQSKRSLAIFRSVVLATATLLSTGLAHSQTENATLQGSVTDPSGAAIPQAEVRITNVATGVVRTLTSDGSGQFLAVGLLPGSYSIHVEHAGFKSSDINAIVLNVGAHDQIPIHLAVGATAETVTVEGSDIQLLTTSPAVSTVVNREEVANMPLNGRSFQDLMLLTPGAGTINPQSGTAAGHNTQNGASVDQITINGDSGLANSYIVDGVNMNVGSGNNGGFYGSFVGGGGLPVSTILGNTQALVPVDDLQEFRVATSGYQAEYGGSSGGQFVFATQSGTNSFHGTASDYVRNTVFDANDWFNNYYSKPLQPLHQNDFSGALGGPIWIPRLYNGKDKSFFFVNYEGLRANFPSAATVAYAPDAALVAATSGAVHEWLASLPKPNGPEVGDGLAEYITGYNTPSSMNTYNVRIDQVITSKHEFFARASRTRSTMTSYYYGGTMPTQQNTSTYTAGLTSSFTTHVTNQLRANYASNAGIQSGYQTPISGQPTFNAITAGGYPANISNIVMFLGYYPSSGGIYAIDFRGFQENRQFEVNDNVSWLLGKHSLKFGADFRRLNGTLLPESPNTGYLWYSTQSLEANTPDYIYNNSDAAMFPGAHFVGVYAQDDWAVSHRLNLSYGLRWDYFPSQIERHGSNPYALLNQDNLSQLAVGPHATPYSASMADFAPRVGATYLVRNTPGYETQLRGGFGIYYDPVTNVGSPLFGMLGPGESGAATFCPYSYCTNQAQYSFPLPQQYLYTPIQPPVGPFTQTFNAVDPHLKDPYTIQVNAAVQQQFGKNNALTLNYVGAFYRRGIYFLNQYVHPQNPNFNYVDFQTNGPHSTSNYNSGQFVFEHRLSRGLFAYAAYTWSHDIGETQISQFTPYIKADTSGDLRNNFNLATSWTVPYKSDNRLAEALLGQWGLDVRFMARTGFPFSVYGKNVPSPDGSGGQVTPGLNYVSGKPVYLYGSYKGKPIPGGKMLNPAAFTAAPVGVNGTVAPNSLRGFGMNQWNFAVRREFPIHDTLKLQFRADSFNLFNRPNFGSIDTYLPDATFGQTTSTLASSIAPGGMAQYQGGGPRSLQLALKIVF